MNEKQEVKNKPINQKSQGNHQEQEESQHTPEHQQNPEEHGRPVQPHRSHSTVQTISSMQN